MKSNRVVWPINALLTVHSEVLPFSENIKNIKMFGVPPPPPPQNTCAIGYVHNEIMPRGNLALQVLSYAIYFAGWFDGIFWWISASFGCYSRKNFINSRENYLVAPIPNRMHSRTKHCDTAIHMSIFFSTRERLITLRRDKWWCQIPWIHA